MRYVPYHTTVNGIVYQTHYNNKHKFNEAEITAHSSVNISFFLNASMLNYYENLTKVAVNYLK